MSPVLDAYRDDGPLARAIARLSGAAHVCLGPSLAGVALVGAALAVEAGSGPLAVAALLVCVALVAAGGRLRPPTPLDWVVVPLLRGLEYGAVIRITAALEPDAMPWAYGLLAAVVFHHYDIVYRLRHQRVAPPSWLGLAGLGWDGRLLVLLVLAATGLLAQGTAVLAVVLGAVFTAESLASWIRVARAERTLLAAADPGMDGA